MNDKAKLRIAAPDQARLVIDVNILAIEEIAWQRGQPAPVWCQHAPGLAGEQFDLVLAHIHPVEPQPEAVAVAGNGCVGGYETEKIRLQITQHVGAVYFGVDPEPGPRILRAEAEFAQPSVYR